MKEEEVRALIREEMRRTLGYGEITEEAARLIVNVVDRATDELDPPGAPEEPANPFAPKRTAEEWADSIRITIKGAEADGYTVWFDFDTEDYSGPGPLLRIGTMTSPGDEDPIICEER